MTLAIIGAGLGRTGTLSLKRALDQLGFDPCHHMEEVLRHPEQIPGWHAAGRGEAVDFRKLLAGYRAAVDWPSAQFWSELAAAFPAGKIILTVRDTERWYQSFSQTILPLLRATEPPFNPAMAAIIAMVRTVVGERAFGGRLDDADHIKACYERHNAAVRATATPDRLLVYEVAEGWEPLCAFLGVTVPTEPFPKVNTTQEFLDRARNKGQ
jgi:hypothetical protein